MKTALKFAGVAVAICLAYLAWACPGCLFTNQYFDWKSANRLEIISETSGTFFVASSG
jgi:hypothetical protein